MRPAQAPADAAPAPPTRQLRLVQPLRALRDRTPLRLKLIAAVLVLVTLGLTAISVAGVSVLNGYLLGRADEQLRESAAQLSRQILNQPPGGWLRVPSEVYAEVRSADGDRVQGTDAVVGQGKPRLPSDLDGRYGRPFTVSGADGSGASWRVLAISLPGGGSIVLGISLSEVRRTVGRLVAIDVLVGLVVLVALAAAGIWVVRASLRPLTAIEETAGAIAAGELSRRVPEGDPRTEMGRLGGSLNTMLAQIEAAFRAREASESTARESERRMRRFVADAGHELRTPLTAIRGFAEFYRQGMASPSSTGEPSRGAARSPEELDRLIGRIEDAAGRMGLLVEDLLLLARLDQQRPLAMRPVDLLAVAADAVQEARVVAPDRPIELAVEGGLAYQVLGDESRLRQVLGNLLSNATTHTPPGTPVEVRLRPGRLPSSLDVPAAVCEVADSGPGLPPEQAQRVFERFYRANPARTREDGGTGLGLAIVGALVAAHGGVVQLESTPGEGAVFRVLLPLAPD